LGMARPRGQDDAVVDIVATVERAATLVRALPVARNREIRVRCHGISDETEVRGDPAQILQVLINLIANGLEACPPDAGCVELTVDHHADAVVIAVTDNGIGMNEETLRHAFDPFFSDKAQRGLVGTGLGLAVSHAIAERHGGQLLAHSDGADCGSTFTLELPIRVREETLCHVHA
ncbi:MAG: HAMP domain-containing histidine kinase, partial [Phycisphaerales bacterium]|nr:HAMP domain-containing histidine kinase [Phycisphaerales bacterium]